MKIIRYFKLYLFIIIISELNNGVIFAQDKLQIAIIDLEPQNISAITSSVISDFLRNDLFDTKKFIVVERTRMENILKEQTFQRTGCTTTECAIEVGKILNVEQMLVGSVSKLNDTYYINVRVVDVATGEVKLSKEVSCKNEDELRNASRKLIIKLTGIPLPYEKVEEEVLDKKDVITNKYKMKKKSVPELSETLKRDDILFKSIEELYQEYDSKIHIATVACVVGGGFTILGIGALIEASSTTKSEYRKADEETAGGVFIGLGAVAIIFGIVITTEAFQIKEEILIREQSFLDNFRFAFSKNSTCLNYSFKF
ncbi:MAG: CsgG/HfaB family protein [Candidatus Firestonebacteria bacterium]